MMTRTRKPISPSAALTRMAGLCSRSEQAESHIRTKLAGMGIAPSDINSIIDQLKDGGFLNESRYAHAFTRDKFRFDGWGRQKIGFKLKAAGIGKAVIDECLDEIDPEAYSSTLLRLLRAKARTVKAREPQLARAALLRFAASRGFEPDVSYPLVAQVMNEINEPCDEEDF